MTTVVPNIAAVCTHLGKQWEAIYREAWSIYYAPKHLKTLLRRAAVTGVPVNSLIKMLVTFATTVQLENVHPLQSGILRLKHLSERRPELPRERALIFWPQFIWKTLSKHVVIIRTIARLLCSSSPSRTIPLLEPTRIPRSSRLATMRIACCGAHLTKVAELTRAARVR
jgi:hypothetical protein